MFPQNGFPRFDCDGRVIYAGLAQSSGHNIIIVFSFNNLQNRYYFTPRKQHRIYHLHTAYKIWVTQKVGQNVNRLKIAIQSMFGIHRDPHRLGGISITRGEDFGR